jgi:hypothetical protein
MNPTKLVDSSHSINTPIRVAPPRGRAPAQARTPISLPTLFKARAEARALLYAACMIDLHEAIDPLQAFAVESGLVNQIGQDAVQAILADAFHAVVRGRR